MSTEIENILIAKQITPTPMRVMVLEYILKQSTATSLSELEKEFQHSDKTTLYRTVKTCLPKEDMPEVELPTGFQLQEVSFVARGICDTCTKNAIQLQATSQ